jgi:folate-binding protein YgfZ
MCCALKERRGFHRDNLAALPVRQSLTLAVPDVSRLATFSPRLRRDVAIQVTEAQTQITIHRSPLDEAHKHLGAVMMEEGEWSFPSSYGDTAAEYRVVREGGAGLIDLSPRGRIEVDGSEAVQFLNGLITNDVKTLKPGTWMRAAFPNVQGRLLAEVRVLRLGDGRFLFDAEAASTERVLKTLERFTLAGDFRVKDLTEEVALISVQGSGAGDVVRLLFGEEASRLDRGRVGQLNWKDRPIHFIRASHTAEDGFDCYVSAADGALLWDAFLNSGARPVGYEALDMLRIEAGVPRYGADTDETNVVLEAVADDAVSFTKGCYVGQEIIARIHWRGHVAKKLTGLRFDDAGETKAGDKIATTDGKEIGRLTSLTFSPRLEALIALGYVKYDYLAPGTAVRVLASESELAAHVVALPFVPGSWYDPAAE